MEKIKPYLLPGLLIFYLVFSVGMIPIGYLVKGIGWNADIGRWPGGFRTKAGRFAADGIAERVVRTM